MSNRYLTLLERKRAIIKAREDLIAFTQLMMPDADHADDPAYSIYDPQKFHRVIGAGLEEIEARKFRRLIIKIGPRFGKTTLASNMFPAWFIGRHPDKSVIVATYNQSYSEDLGRRIRDIMQSPAYKQVFPDLEIKQRSAAVNRVETTAGGVVFCVGRGSAITGRGAHCLAGNTIVQTKTGPKNIRDIVSGEMVLSYDLTQARPVWAVTQAVARRPRARVCRVTTAAGRVVEATPEHRFYTGQGWRECGSLTPGDALLCDVRQDVRARCSRRQETRTARSQGVLLFWALCVSWAQSQTVWRKGLHSLRGTSANPRLFWRTLRRAHLLLSRLSGSGASGGIAGARSLAAKGLRALRRVVCSTQQRLAFLLDPLQEQGALASHAWPTQSALAGWGASAAVFVAQPEALSRGAPARDAPGWPPLSGLWRNRQAGGASSQRGEHRQPREQSGNAVSAMSQQDAFLGGEKDFVAAVDADGRETDVYDLQIEGTRCFFANGILVHNCIILDDPLKDRKEADSAVIRDTLWSWFTQVLRTRLMNKTGVIVLITTQWTEDDLIGRLTDPLNPFYTIDEARLWHKIDLPALAEDDDILKREPGESLWPERFDKEYLEEIRVSDPRGFNALYQGRPSPREGAFFRAEDMITYNSMRDLPAHEEMRFYGASDHAVTQERQGDKTCLMVVGVDKADHLWIMPDVIWHRLDSNVAVESMLILIEKYKPQFWWAENGQVTKSIAPFLRKRMLEKRVFCAIDPITPAQDKQQRAQSIQARAAMKMVHFPGWTRWWGEAQDQILKFPLGNKDDFVDTLALIGLGLNKMRPRTKQRPVTPVVAEGTFRALLAGTRRREGLDRRKRSLNGWL